MSFDVARFESDVATRGFVRLAADLETAWDEGRPASQTAFERVGRVLEDRLDVGLTSQSGVRTVIGTSAGSQQPLASPGDHAHPRRRGTDHPRDCSTRRTTRPSCA